jgi:tetratricopeptide (TPR) repeat protein
MEGDSQASIHDFVAFLRSASTPEDQIPKFQKVAEQLLLAMGAQDLLKVSPEQMNGWLELLRARNPTEAQLALVGQGLAAIQVFQRRRAAAAATKSAAPQHPPLPPKPPMSGPKKWLAIGGLGIVLVLSIVYTVSASREAVLETEQQSELVQRGIEKRGTGILKRGFTFTFQPKLACPGAIDDVNEAVRVWRKGDTPEATRLLEGALKKDPRCVAAAKGLSVLLARSFGPFLELRRRLESRAQADSSDAAAQVMAAYMARQAGDGKAMKKYMERAEAADPTQPLLQNLWGTYWESIARPRDFAKELTAYRKEVERTGDPGTISNLMAVYMMAQDFDRSGEMCRRYYEQAPDDQEFPYLATCLRAAIGRGDASEEQSYLKRYWAARVPPEESRACTHADLASFYNRACRPEDALREADVAIAQGCAVPGAGHRREALLLLHRYEEAAVPPPDGGYWKGDDPNTPHDPEGAYADQLHRATALVMVGRDAEALSVLQPITGRSPKAQVLATLTRDGVAKERLGSLGSCKAPTPAERLAGAAAGYLGYLIADDARPLLDKALAADPKSTQAWANQVFLLSFDGKLNEAVQAGEKAKQSGGWGAAVAGNVGYVYQQLGDCEKAIPLFKETMLGSPWNVPNYTNLAKCLEAVGRDDEAKAIWRYVQGGRPRVFWWMIVLVVGGGIGLYFGARWLVVNLFRRRSAS